jgi:hypothetical protein
MNATISKTGNATVIKKSPTMKKTSGVDHEARARQLQKLDEERARKEAKLNADRIHQQYIIVSKTMEGIDQFKGQVSNGVKFVNDAEKKRKQDIHNWKVSNLQYKKQQLKQQYQTEEKELQQEYQAKRQQLQKKYQTEEKKLQIK